MDFLIVFAAALVPMIVGFIWYNPRIFGKAWMNASGMTEEKMKGANMFKIFGVTFLFSLMLAVFMIAVVIHQAHIFSILGTQPDSSDPNSQSSVLMKQIMDLYGNSYRTFKHGAFHGTLAGIFLALPLLGINALFERKSFKYIFINAGYWIISMALMGGILCAFIKLG
jgi:hypothetical protein